MPNLVFVAQFISARMTKAGGEFRPPTCYVTRAVLMRKHVRSFEVNISQLTAFILTQESISGFSLRITEISEFRILTQHDYFRTGRYFYVMLW